mmetsp:Transcript_9478/g.21996  ORF Transcript_9478/g.21996 Transcript_9478/m.21996 type:complete len:309 (+) Transcript_9478:1245-2171(+)
MALSTLPPCCPLFVSARKVPSMLLMAPLMHTPSSITEPKLHWHVNEPSVLVQTASSPQRLSRHSFTSSHWPSVVSANPESQVQLVEPGVAVEWAGQSLQPPEIALQNWFSAQGMHLESSLGSRTRPGRHARMFSRRESDTSREAASSERSALILVPNESMLFWSSVLAAATACARLEASSCSSAVKLALVVVTASSMFATEVCILTFNCVKAASRSALSWLSWLMKAVVCVPTSACSPSMAAQILLSSCGSDERISWPLLLRSSRAVLPVISRVVSGTAAVEAAVTRPPMNAATSAATIRTEATAFLP